jgi:hypothetical protein
MPRGRFQYAVLIAQSGELAIVISGAQNTNPTITAIPQFSCPPKNSAINFLATEI